MRSLILSTATKYLFPMLLLFSAFLLLRGHNLPGGGFAGGLVAAGGVSLHGFAYGMNKARLQLHISPIVLIASGLLAALGSGILPLFLGDPFLTGLWADMVIGGPGELKLGTPFLFDVGVFLVVMGSTLAIIFALGEES